MKVLPTHTLGGAYEPNCGVDLGGIGMKRYWVFAYAHYYPGGGMGDFYNDYHSLEEAKKLVHGLTKRYDKYSSGVLFAEFDQAEIFDTRTRQLVFDSHKGEIDWEVGHDASDFE